MAQIEQSDNGGKKKKGAQKKMTIHVDFTPMVDMNMLLITFFMLCTTMIKSQTLQLALPSNEKVENQNKNQTKASEAITMILDTEYDAKTGEPMINENGSTKHVIYYYEGKPDSATVKQESFLGNAKGEFQGIRKILSDRNKEVLKKYVVLKQEWRDGKITKEEFDKKSRENASDSTLKRPVVIIKPGPNATYEALINAVDEMQIYQISRYNIELPNATDSALIAKFKGEAPAPAPAN